MAESNLNHSSSSFHKLLVNDEDDRWSPLNQHVQVYPDNPCQYYSSAKNAKIDPEGITFLHVNCGSINSDLKMDQIYNLAMNLDSTVLGITETWINDDAAQTYVGSYFQNYTPFFLNRPKNKRGGGVALLVKDGISSNVRHDISWNTDADASQALFVEVMPIRGQGKFLIGVVYRPPKSCVSSFLTLLDSALTSISREKSHCFIMGDFNFDLLSNNKEANDFLATTFSYNFLPQILYPTRITDHSATLLDNIFTNAYVKPLTSGIVVSKVSDHLPIFTRLSLNQKILGDDLSYSRRIYNSENWQKFENHIQTLAGDIDVNNQTVNMLYDTLITDLQTGVDLCFPIQYKKCGKQRLNHKPWMTKGILKSLKTRDKLYAKKLKHPNSANNTNYKNFQNVLCKVIARAKRLHFHKIFQAKRHDIQGMWKEINIAMGKPMKKSNAIKLIKTKSDSFSSDEDVANSLNNFFVSVSQDLGKKFPMGTEQHLKHMDKNKNPIHSFMLTPTCPSEVQQIIRSLNSKRSSGPDGISTTMLKKIAYIIAPRLSAIINKSFEDGEVPCAMKLAKVIPIFKKGDKSAAENYRPISLTTCFSKVIEKVFKARIMNYFKKINIINQNQYGFRTNHSTVDALHKITNTISEALDSNDYCIGIFIDLMKAFDTVNHEILLSKLEYYGIRGTALAWIRSFLTDRKQYVCVNNVNSNVRCVRSGVPQGSVLGPLLFLIYINDLFNVPKYLNTVAFADDTNFLLKHNSLTTAIQLINDDLGNIADWLTDNKLTLNTSKSHYIVFHGPHKSPNMTDVNSIVINTVPLTRVESTTILGLTIHQNLKWDNHISKVNMKISKIAGIMQKLKSHMPTSVLKIIYITLLQPHLTYAITVWGAENFNLYKAIETRNQTGSHCFNLGRNHGHDKLLLTQKRAVRAMLKKTSREHTIPLFVKEKLLEWRKVYTLHVAILMYKYTRGMLPSSYDTIIKWNRDVAPRYNTRQTAVNHLPVPQKKYMVGTRDISFMGIKTWNELPESIKNKSSLLEFKAALNQFLLQAYTGHLVPPAP